MKAAAIAGIVLIALGIYVVVGQASYKSDKEVLKIGGLAAAGRVCEEKLPRFKRPKWIRAVVELPRTATGKIQRFKLRELIERELADKS